MITSQELNLRLSQYGICSRPYSTLTRKLSRMRMIKRPETELDDVEQESSTIIWLKTVNSELVLKHRVLHSLTSQLMGSYILLPLGRILT